MSNIELKPCPFCGGQADIDVRSTEVFSTWYDAARVFCRECGASTKGILYDENAFLKGERYKEAIEAWNRRSENEV